MTHVIMLKSFIQLAYTMETTSDNLMYIQGTKQDAPRRSQ